MRNHGDPIRRFWTGQLAAILLAMLAGPALAQTDSTPPTIEGPVAERCREAGFRQFDFWLGTWEVRNGAGELLGTNEIRRIARGCGLMERWRGAGGGRGTSVNAYDPARRTWTQRWVGDGATLWLEGGMVDDRMVLTGTARRSTPHGPAVDRISWTPLPDGRIRQLWEVSADSGARWRTIFEGFYRKTTATIRDDR